MKTSSSSSSSLLGVVALVLLCSGWTIQGMEAGFICPLRKTREGGGPMECPAGTKCLKMTNYDPKNPVNVRCDTEATCKMVNDLLGLWCWECSSKAECWEGGIDIEGDTNKYVKKCYKGEACGGNTTSCVGFEVKSSACHPPGDEVCTIVKNVLEKETTTHFQCSTKKQCENHGDSCKSCDTDDCNKPGGVGVGSDGSGGSSSAHKSAQGLGLVMILLMMIIYSVFSF